MGKIGNMGARAAHHFLAVADQTVELGGERFDLGREFSDETARLAGADMGERDGEPAQRLKPHAHLEEDRADEAEPQDHEGPDQHPGEARDFGLDLAHVAGDEEGVAARVVGLGRRRNRELDALRDEAHALALRT